MKLYEISQGMAEVEALILEEELDADQAADLMDQMNDLFSDKVQDITRLIGNLEMKARAIKGEEERLVELVESAKSRRKSLEHRVDWLADYIQRHMEANQIKKLEYPEFIVSVVNRTPVVRINDLEVVPDDYIKVKTSVVADKVKIREAIKDGKSIPGAELLENKGLRIK